MGKAKYTRGANGLYQTKVWDGTYTESGKKHRVSVYSAKSSRDLEQKVAELTAKVNAGQIVLDQNVDFIEYARQWRKAYKGAASSKNTQAMYDNIIEKHLITLAGTRLVDIRKIHLQDLINSHVDKPRIMQQLVLTFKQIIKAAMSDRLLPATAYLDICTGITVPKYKAEEKRPLTDEEKAAVKACCDPSNPAAFSPREKLFVLLIYGCGLRRGEALALTWFNVNLKTMEISITQNLAFEKNSNYLKDPKSSNGKRTVPIPEYLRDALQSAPRTGPLIQSRKKGYLTPSGYRRLWESITAKMNQAAGGSESVHVIFDLTAHIFRHNYCTALCYQVPAISLERIAALMGDDLKTILAVYSHVQNERQDVSVTIQNAVSL